VRTKFDINVLITHVLIIVEAEKIAKTLHIFLETDNGNSKFCAKKKDRGKKYFIMKLIQMHFFPI
jgi:hypothetical protein